VLTLYALVTSFLRSALLFAAIQQGRSQAVPDRENPVCLAADRDANLGNGERGKLMEIVEQAPKVSVCVVTYNQEKYIGQCLQSVVDQETDFDFEVLVADDCSTDGTRLILHEFANKYPGIVKPILSEVNVG
jgi:cellulose synthase/poly-beta-1,6-N-acetylglucosamine synthase-like glycosyltransferase